jgi:hypothetical protein
MASPKTSSISYAYYSRAAPYFEQDADNGLSAFIDGFLTTDLRIFFRPQPQAG